MSFMSEVICEGYANTSSSETLKEQFNKFCDWRWGHSYGDCDICRREYHKLHIPLRIAEKQKQMMMTRLILSNGIRYSLLSFNDKKPSSLFTLS